MLANFCLLRAVNIFCSLGLSLGSSRSMSSSPKRKRKKDHVVGYLKDPFGNIRNKNITWEGEAC